jgi:outer membrane protein OmpA-like peptidoglycan-associated protein
MQVQRKSRLIVAGLLASVALAGCAPRVFADTSGLAIVGTAPPPVEAEPPPPEPQKRVEVRENKIVINEKIQFLVNSDKILDVSHSLLDEVAKVIKDHPQIKKIEIEGHASAEGTDAKNQKLSDRRAKAVLKYLTSKGGIDKSILSAKGYGETRPIADNETEDGREKNRRVEFTITDQEVTQTKVEVDDKGNEKVVTPPAS